MDDIQSWWEVPSIAHFCSLFRAAFNLLDFDIEELEEALLTDGTEDSGSSLLQELIVRLLCGCLGNNDVSTFNYQMFLRRLFRQKCQEHGRYNPFNTDIDFQFLPLRTKVEILHALCDFRLDAEDVLDLLKNLEAESLRVEPLGYDDNESAYWYFYGTRLYREDYEKSSKKSKQKKSVWQVVCFTEQDWNHLTSKFKGATSKTEKALYRSLSENFLPEIPRLFQEKERQQRKRLLELQPRRSSSRVQKQREEEAAAAAAAAAAIAEAEAKKKKTPVNVHDSIENDTSSNKSVTTLSARELRAIQRDVHKSGSGSEVESRTDSPLPPSQLSSNVMPPQKSVNSGLTTTSVGRQTNNSLASATGQILIQSSTQRKKLKTSQVFRQTEEDLQTGMYKILEYVKNHDDAWPFIEPVEEDYAPNYYSIVRKPMDLQRMEDKLDSGEYQTFSRFKGDFQLIVNNCRLYNGTDNEYTEMVDNLQQAFQRATDRFLDQITSSDEEVAVETTVSSKESQENVTNSKKSKKGRKEHKNSTKRKSSPIDKTKVNRIVNKTRTKIGESRDIKKSKIGGKKEKNKIRDKSPTVTVNSKKSGKKGAIRQTRSPSVTKMTTVSSRSRSCTRSRSRSRSRSHSRSRSRSRSFNRSKARSWTSSPSPPPPRIQKKKRNKEKPAEFLPEPLKSIESDTFWQDQIIKKLEPVVPVVEEYKPDISKTLNGKKEKNSQLRETIEKLKQNRLNHKDQFQNFKTKCREINKKEKVKKIKSKTNEKLKENKIKHVLDMDSTEFDNCNTKDSSSFISTKKSNNKKVVKKAGVIRNQAAIKALDLATEQTLKDINKWLDDTPKYSDLSSPSNSPMPLSNLDEFDLAASNLESEYKQISQQKQQQQLQQQAQQQQSLTLQPQTQQPKSATNSKAKDHSKDTLKRRTLTKDFNNKVQKRREIQRTIDRLQPGKSKGNLIANIQSNKNTDDTAFPPITLAKKDSKIANANALAETAPKLSLGTVLDSFGQQHNFVDDEKPPENETAISNNLKEDKVENAMKVSTEDEKVDNIKKEESETTSIKLPKQENVTPNLSAWFKAFGAPKSSTVSKKKADPENDSSKESENVISPISTDERLQKSNNESTEDPSKKMSPTPSPAPDITLGAQQPMPRMRKASTGSSVSERSSFSQDMTDPLDSPRLSVDERLGVYPAPYPSPLHRSPAGGISPVMSSPQTDDVPRNTASYPPLNANIRVGFYQDTVKSSPEKSCSPRDQPQYSQHVYIPPPSTSTYQYSNPCSDPSPAQSPIYSQPSTPYPPPPYSGSHNIINSYFETSKPLEYSENPAIVTSTVEKPRPTEVISSKSHLNTVIPVKKRLYSETTEMDSSHNNVSRISPSSQSLGVSRIHDIYNNRDLETTSLLHQQSQLPLVTPPSKPYSQSVDSNLVKNYSISTDVTSRNKMDIANRGLNLQIPSTEPLNIPNPIKTIDLTGPDSPSLYNRPVTSQPPSTTMNMPLDIDYPRVTVTSSLDMTHLPPQPQYTRLDGNKSDTVVQSSVAGGNPQLYNVRGMPVDMNLHNSHLDLRIPTVRTSNETNQNTNDYTNLRSNPFTTTSTIGLDPATLGLRGNLANLSHIVDRYQNDERLMSSLNPPNPYYPDKPSAQSLFSKGTPISTSSSHSMLSTSSSYIPTTLQQQQVKPNSTSITQQQIVDKKVSKKRKSKTASPALTIGNSSVSESSQGFQSYSGLKSTSANSSVVVSEPSAISLKTTSVVPGSAFNFGPASSSLGLSSAIYNEKDSYSGFLDEYRNPTNYYMAAAAAAHHRSTPSELSGDKVQRGGVPPPSPQQNNPPPTAASSYAYLSHPQSRPATYSPFAAMNPHQPSLMDTSSPIYQQYLQRHQEELLRHSAGVLHQSLLAPPTAYPPGYPLGIRQPFDAINRPSWL